MLWRSRPADAGAFSCVVGSGSGESVEQRAADFGDGIEEFAGDSLRVCGPLGACRQDAVGSAGHRS